ncbi:molecular chaperone DnaJ, partial [Ectopseudomonas khazarica]
MSCWEHLGIEPTDDQNAIRTAYRTRLPEVHPERDPEGFQALRGAYEDALRHARGETNEAGEAVALPSASEQAVQQFVELLQDAGRRFRPGAWQDYCRSLDQLPLDVLESIDGSLRHLLLSNGPLSHHCAQLLTERMAWANRLMQLPFEEAEPLDQLLQRIAEPDPFDLATLSDWPSVAQVENLWYVRTLEHLFQNRPLQEFRGWSSLHLCLPMPADPAYYPHLYRQCTLAGVALSGALEHYQARHAEQPDDLDILYLLALQKQHHDQDALDLWTRLWLEREMPEAAAWLLAWSAYHAPEHLPLLIMACDRSQQDVDRQYALDDNR